MRICFFSDKKAANFHPLTLTRPVDDLRIGLFTICQKWKFAFQTENISRTVPDYLSGLFPKGEISEKEDCIWINSRFLPSQELLQEIQDLEENKALRFEEDVVAVKLSGEKSQHFLKKNSFPAEDFESISTSSAKGIEQLWDITSANSAEIGNDIPQSNLTPASNLVDKYDVKADNPENIFIADDVIIEPGCIFIAQEGPIVIQKGVTIEAGSILRGPVAVCENATVKMTSRISGGTTIGPVCKVGGEVSACIFHSYTNKAHNGFAGNSIFGQWVNLGANTTTSNLKNDYSNIKIMNWNSDRIVNTGVQFFGTVMGDHSKTAINTSLNTGTLCGVSANIFLNELTPKRIPSFSWMGSLNPEIYRFEKALDVMESMMKRRNKKLTDAYREMMNHIFENR